MTSRSSPRRRLAFAGLTTVVAIGALALSGVARAQVPLDVLHAFPSVEGIEPASLIQATDGHFYGTTSGGGINERGTAFRMTTDGTVTVLHSFQGPRGGDPTDGANPSAALIQAADRNFYGTTSFGGITDRGTAFKVTADGSVTIVHAFGAGAGGAVPGASLVQATDGNFYGTTLKGGRRNLGTVYNSALFTR